MKATELRELSVDELNAKINDIHEELFNLRFQKANNRLEKQSQISFLKKDIARIKTILTERKMKK